MPSAGLLIGESVLSEEIRHWVRDTFEGAVDAVKAHVAEVVDCLEILRSCKILELSTESGSFCGSSTLEEFV